jgi:hypothetical protein
MTPDDINIGEELQGTSGASAPTAHYTYNVWEGTDNNTHYQTMNADTGTPNAPVCYVVLQGPFRVKGPLPPGAAAPIINTGYELFDATTGNLLMWGFFG